MSASSGPECDLLGNTNRLVACRPATIDRRIRLSLSWKYAPKSAARRAESASLTRCDKSVDVVDDGVKCRVTRQVAAALPAASYNAAGCGLTLNDEWLRELPTVHSCSVGDRLHSASDGSGALDDD